MSPDAAENTVQFSPLVLADRLVTLAKQADIAGYSDIASTLVWLTEWALEQHPPAVTQARHTRARAVQPFCGLPAAVRASRSWNKPHAIHEAI